MRKFPLLLVLISCASMLFAQENVVIIYEDEKPKKDVKLPTNEFAISVGDNMFETQITEEARMGYGAYTLSYHNRLKKWFWYGAYLNVFPTQNWGDGYYDYQTDRWVYSPDENYTSIKISLAPSIRFSYLNKPLVTLYSGLSLGWGLVINQNQNQDNRLSFFYHATLFGFSVGKKFFAGGEIGLGYRGLYSINLGYRF